MTKNKFVIILAVILFALSSTAFSQRKNEVYPLLHNEGVFVFWGNKIDSKNTVYIERQTNAGKWDTVARILKPGTFEEFQNNLSIFSKYFSDFALPGQAEAQKIWSKIEQYGLADSLGMWASTPVVLLAVGTSYLDTALLPNSYIYRITIKDEAGSVISSAVSKPVKYPLPANFGKIKFVNYKPGKDNIYSEWVAKEPFPNQVRVLRAEENSNKFELINPIKGFAKRHDSLFVFIKDTLITKGARYNYYLEPISLFEIKGANSDTALMTNWDINSLVLQEFKVKNIDSINSNRLYYQISDPSMVGIVKIYRSISADTGYSLIAEIPSNQQEYFDNSGAPMQKYYYALKFVDNYGNETGLSVKGFATYSSKDKPFAPKLFSAEGTKDGVLLKWISYDKNIDGFYVYRTDGALPKLEIIAPMIKLKSDSVYTYLDSSKTLRGNRFYLYSVRCESTSHVKSDFSDTLTARPQFPTVPLSPVDVAVSVEENGIKLSWADLSLLDKDVIGYSVYRKEKGSAEEYSKISAALLDMGHNYFIDTAAVEDKEYQYAVTSKDMFGGESSKAGMLTAGKTSPVPPPPADIKLYPMENNIMLRWDPVQSNITEYMIYRYERGVEPVLVGSVKQNDDPEFTDSKVEKGKLYFYYIKTKDSKGKESESGPESSVRFE
jgi:fibronectin type 3 domain-containing protein